MNIKAQDWNYGKMIKVAGLQKVIDQRAVLDIGRLDVHNGEIVGINGPPGSGCSTFFDILIGQLLPSAGTILIDGLSPQTQWDKLAHRVGVVFENDHLYSRLSVEENLNFTARLLGIEKDAVVQTLERVGLVDQKRNDTARLGGSMRRRLSFGRAILHAPTHLLLREPFARCDQVTIRFLSDLLVELAEGGTSILALAEDRQYLEPILDRSFRLDHGTLVEGRPVEGGSRPDHPFKIPIREEGRVALLNPGDVLFADVEEGRAFLTSTSGERLQTQFTLTELENRLRLKGFFRAHRGYLVNLQHVTEVIPFTRNSFSLRMDDETGTLIPLSKAAAAELKELLDY
ncbi:MAG: ATP-binding cassette domain-containing protein [Anaerolineales bacterium]|jgi:ABC-2 type transport system ATP-binding protein